jgi:tetratricopeptide (TPR) repeat protein
MDEEDSILRQDTLWRNAVMEAEKYFWQDKQGNVYGPFRMDEEGNPHAGDVVRYHRLLKHMSTKALGKAIGKSPRHVQEMERDNMVPEMISRRKALIRVLGIPSILLFPNLYSDDDLVRVENQQKPQPIQEYRSSASGSLDLRYCSEMLQLYWTIYHTSTVQNLLGAIEGKIATLQLSKQKEALPILCQYRQLAATIVGDRAGYERAFMHLDAAIAIAEEIKDPALEAYGLFRRGLLYFEQGNFVQAAIDLEKACSLVNMIPITLAGRIMLSAGNISAHIARLPDERRKALNLLDRAGSIVRAGRKEEDIYGIKLHVGLYHVCRAEALLAIGNTIDASEELQQANEIYPKDQMRRHNYVDMLQTRTAVDSGEYMAATSLALSTLEGVKDLQSEYLLRNVIKVYNQLVVSDYRKSPDVRDLGDKLREWSKQQLH